MAQFWNPFSWFAQISKTGHYLEKDPIGDSTPTVALPLHTFVDPKNPDDKSQQNYYEKLALVKKFYDVIQTRKQLLATLRDIGKSPIVQIVKSTYMNEGFFSNNNSDVVDIKYVPENLREKFQGIIDDFMSDFKIQQLLAENIPQLIQMGELLLTPKFEQGKGVVAILDNARLDDILPIYRGQDRVQFFKMTQNPSNPVQELDPDTFIHFMLPGEPIRVQVEYPNGGMLEIYNLPETIKMGKSILFHALDMIKRLDMLDVANLALALRKILMPVLLSIGVPAGTHHKDIVALTEYYENHIESIFAEVGQINTINLTELITLSSKIRALPQYSDGKGALSVLDMGDAKVPDSEQTDRIKKDIANVTDTPAFALLSDAEPVDRATLLKNYSKFTKRLAEIQFAVKQGITTLLIKHFQYLGFPVKAHEISINFKQIVNIDLLDRLEFLVGSCASLKELYDTVSAIAQDENSGLELDPDVLQSVIDSVLNEIPGAKGLLKRRKNVAEAQADLDPTQQVSNTLDSALGMEGLLELKESLSSYKAKIEDFIVRKYSTNTKVA